MDDDGPPGPEHLQALGDSVEQLGVGDAHDLRLDAGGIGQRPEDIERRAEVQALADRLDEPHRRVELRGEHKADVGLADALGDDLRAGVDIDAQLIENIGRAAAAGDAAVAVLGDVGAGAGRHEGGGRGDIERLDVRAAGAAGVDHVRRNRP